MVVLRKTLEELNRTSFDHLINSSPITSLAPGSIARALVESVNRQVADLYQVLDISMAQVFLSLAAGAYLDLIGDMLGVERSQEATAQVYADDRVVRFYVEEGTLGQKLPHPSDATKGRIPSGTTIVSRDGQITYTTPANTDFPLMSTEVYVAANASVAGQAGNLGRGELDTHNIGVDDVFVTNVESIRTGQSVEDDDTYRARISNQVLAAQTANETAVRLATLSVPGVADAVLSPGVAGAGSFRVLLIPFGNRVPSQTLLGVRRALGDVAAYGIRVFVEEPDYLPISLTLKLTFTEVLTTQAVIKQQVENLVRGYIGDIRPGQRMFTSRLRNSALDADSTIADVQLVELCVDHRPTLLHDYTLEDDQVFLPDTTIDDPIRIL